MRGPSRADCSFLSSCDEHISPSLAPNAARWVGCALAPAKPSISESRQKRIEARLDTPCLPTMSSSSASNLRLMSDLKTMKQNPPEGVSASPLGDENLHVWGGTIFGTDDTPWEGGIYSMRLTFPEQYPDKPPRVRFTSEMVSSTCPRGEQLQQHGACVEGCTSLRHPKRVAAGGGKNAREARKKRPSSSSRTLASPQPLAAPCRSTPPFSHQIRARSSSDSFDPAAAARSCACRGSSTPTSTPTGRSAWT